MAQWAVMLLLSCAFATQAADFPPAKKKRADPLAEYLIPNPEMPPVEFKGVPMGASLETFKITNPNFECKDSAGSVTDCYFFVSSKPCPGVYSPELTGCIDRFKKQSSYGGIQAKNFSAHFRNDALGMVLISISPQNFNDLLDALSLKYGKPHKLNHTIIQNRMGATFDDSEAKWIGNSANITLKKYSGSIDRGYVSLASHAYVEASIKERSEKRGKAASDL